MPLCNLYYRMKNYKKLCSDKHVTEKSKIENINENLNDVLSFENYENDNEIIHNAIYELSISESTKNLNNIPTNEDISISITGNSHSDEKSSRDTNDIILCCSDEKL